MALMLILVSCSNGKEEVVTPTPTPVDDPNSETEEEEETETEEEETSEYTDINIVNRTRVLSYLEYLSSDELGGREVLSAGNTLAKNYIISHFEDLELDVIQQTFNYASGTATNIYVKIEGTDNSDETIVVTAHYDHIGPGNSHKRSTPQKTTDNIYNGADDNASGVAGLLEFATYFNENKPKNDIIFLALDAEEVGLKGASYFTAYYSGISDVILNYNMDMISRNDDNILNLCGINRSPSLASFFENRTLSSDINITKWHDGSDGRYDWTGASDHGEFYKKGIPFIYFGVEDHIDYHKVSDEYKNIQPDFYIKALDYIANSLIIADGNL